MNPNVKSVDGLSNIGRLFSQPGSPEDGTKTTNRYEIVTTVSYLIGIDETHLNNYFRAAGYGAELDRIKENKDAVIIRYLQRIRSSLIQNFTRIDSELKSSLKNLDQLPEFHADEIRKLESYGVYALQPNFTANRYMEHINKLIQDHIGSCKPLFPDWVNFSYIKDMFVVPKFQKRDVMKEEYARYHANKNSYPFQAYIHWDPEKSSGNIVNSDGRFLNLLYQQHDDVFDDRSKYIDAGQYTKENIYDFIRRSEKAIIAVDCENSDVYKLYGVLKNLEEDELEKVDHIILYDDANTSCGWDWLEQFIKIPVRHVEVERVTNRKSLVDIKMTAGICEAHYRDGIDSFILCSSDSDFWGLISSLQGANFLVMYEYEKCGKPIKDAMNGHGIFHCSIDDFYTGNAEDLKRNVLISKLREMSQDAVGRKSWDITKEVYELARITAAERDMEQFHSKYVKTMRLVLDDDGIFRVMVRDS